MAGVVGRCIGKQTIPCTATDLHTEILNVLLVGKFSNLSKILYELRSYAILILNREIG